MNYQKSFKQNQLEKYQILAMVGFILAVVGATFR